MLSATIDISKQSWFQESASQRVMHALRQGGAEPRFVGGCVRDSLCGRTVHDIDIATTSLPEITLSLLEGQGIKAIPTGIEHGTITAVCEGRTFEITTLRSDVSTDGRRATVAFSDDWLEDAKRRDFTFNAMSVDINGDIYDPFDGVKDLRLGIVRFVGDAESRIREDYLRLLRFFRFTAFYGKGSPGRATLQVCSDLADGLDGLSGERISQEMLRLLAAPNPAKWVRLMVRGGILSHLISDAEDSHALEMMCAFEDKPDALRRLAILLPETPGAVEEVVKRWHLSNKQKDRLMAARANKENLIPTQPLEELRAFLYRYGAICARDQLFIYWAEKQFSGIGPAEQAVLSTIDAWEENPVKFPIKGQDLIEQGAVAGPELGQQLKQIENWWCEGGCQADKDACLSFYATLS
ncbi:CCA tRNA nucleotidyltransferase [Terasakiella sp. A23]|uniref:CCA tRNA nucleotidyltransferase n=1 Tax=Terasakiella sp. FCG-A23 TaxID=3080561 RepID=UPI002955175F|nr:CCA tRNA nucleotidyltransferase [Terasakiella sp. A23]MDV7338421.1 CCA tRNA nucleotidyltransferase [Terasakiella sp. A23]